MSELRELYLKALGLSDSSKAAARKEALSRAHDIRKFEIELYWKRANYFWLLQAAVFAGLGFVWKNDGSNIPSILPAGLSCLGVITSYRDFYLHMAPSSGNKLGTSH